MSARASRIAGAMGLVVCGLCAACPPFDALPFPAEGEGEGEGAEGEGEGDGQCPAVTAPTCTPAFATQLDPWQKIKVTPNDEGAVTALAADTTNTPTTLLIANSNGELFRFDVGTPHLIGTCTGGALTAPVIAERIFVNADHSIIASGTNGVCVVDAGGAVAAFELGDSGTEHAAVPIGANGDDVVVASITGSNFLFSHYTRSGNAFTLVTPAVGTRALPPGGGPVMVAAPTVDGTAALFADEEGILYRVDNTFALVSDAALLPASAPSGLVFAPDAAGVQVALMTSSALEIGSIASSELVSGGITALDAPLIARAPAEFASAIDRVGAVALRASDGARLDVGLQGYATFAAAADAPHPVGACVRVAALVDLEALPCGTLWGLSFSGTVIAWDPDAAESDAVATLTSASGVAPGFSMRSVVPVDDQDALVADGSGFAVATRNGSAIDLKNASLPFGVAGFALGATRPFVIATDGTVSSFTLDDPQNTLAASTPTLGTDSTGNNTDLVAVGDPGFTAGSSVGFFAAGNVSGQPELLHCTTDVAAPTLNCDGPVALGGVAAPAQFSSIAVTANGVVIVTNTGPVFVRDATSSIVVDSTIVPGDQPPWDDGNGRIIDTGDGCILVTGFSGTPYIFDENDNPPGLIATGIGSVDPFMSTAVLLEPGHILGSGGNGDVFYDVRYDATASSCRARFANATKTVLGVARPTGDILSAAFVDDDAWVGDRVGFIWHLPTFSP